MVFEMVEFLILVEHERRILSREVLRIFGNNSYHTVAIFVIIFWMLVTLGTGGIAGPFALVLGFPTCMALVVAGFFFLFTIILAPVGLVFL
jgi:hypothetical protein